MENLGAAKSRIYKGHSQTPENLVWHYQGPQVDPYQREHDLLFAAIRNDKPYNETERAAKLPGVHHGPHGHGIRLVINYDDAWPRILSWRLAGQDCLARRPSSSRT